MKLTYLSLSYVPSRRASSVHVMKMCAALAARRNEVTLVTKLEPSRMESGVSDVYEFYGVEPRFEIVKLPRPDWRGGGLIFLHHLNELVSTEVDTTDLVYSRDLPAAVIAARKQLPVIFEAHSLPTGRLARRLFRNLIRSPTFVRLVVISEALRRSYENSGLLPPGLDVVVAHDAADLPKKKIGGFPPLPLGREDAGVTHVGYAGHLYPGRGIEILVALARSLESFDFHIVGGMPTDISRWSGRSLPSNLRLHGFVHPSELGTFYESFDILVAPYQRAVTVASGGNTAAWMSPMKIFEYMAARKPIVCSDLPVLREVLRHRDNAILVEPEDVAAWRGALEELARDPQLGRRLARQAASDMLSKHTWERRAEAVLNDL